MHTTFFGVWDGFFSAQVSEFTNSESSDPGEHCMHNSLICIVPDRPDTATISRMVTIWSGYAYKNPLGSLDSEYVNPAWAFHMHFLVRPSTQKYVAKWNEMMVF